MQPKGQLSQLILSWQQYYHNSIQKALKIVRPIKSQFSMT